MTSNHPIDEQKWRNVAIGVTLVVISHDRKFDLTPRNAQHDVGFVQHDEPLVFVNYWQSITLFVILRFGLLRHVEFFGEGIGRQIVAKLHIWKPCLRDESCVFPHRQLLVPFRRYLFQFQRIVRWRLQKKFVFEFVRNYWWTSHRLQSFLLSELRNLHMQLL